MKSTLIRTTVVTFAVLLFSLVAVAQAPQRMSYQAVIRNAEGTLLTSSAIGVKVSLLQGSETGTAVYEETFTGTTNENGLLTLELGGGTPVSGSFAAINWSTGIYYVKTETDPTGGTNYSITAVGQLLSVPYAFYSSNSSVQGKTTIILTGDLTDAEAAAQLTRELGYNTENIIIDGTTQLTAVDFSGATNLISIDITNNVALTTVNFSHLAKLFRTLDISGNPALTAVNFPELVKCNGLIMAINNNDVLSSIQFPALLDVSKGDLSIGSNPALTSISLPVLKKSNGVHISHNATLATIDLPVFKEVVELTIEYCPNLATLTMAALETVNMLNLYDIAVPSMNFPLLTANTYFNLALDPVLTSLSVPMMNNCSFAISSAPSLTSLDLTGFHVGNNISISDTGLTSFAFGNLTTCTNLQFINNLQLTAVDFSTLQAIAGFIIIINNPTLHTIGFPTTIGMVEGNNHLDLQCQNNALTSATVNDILHKLLNFTSVTGNYYQFQNQNPPAPPTGQGLLDKQTLISMNNGVITD